MDKIIVVTAAASGIGLASAKALLQEGASIAMSDINHAALEQQSHPLIERYGAVRILVLPADVTKRESVRQLLATTKEKFGRLDGIANVAGTGGHKIGHEQIWQTDDKEFDFIINLNVRGLFHMLSEALEPGVLQEPGTSFVHITSMFGERSFEKAATLLPAKTAANGIVRSAAIEGGKRGIRVNAVLPGPINTPMHQATQDSSGDHPVSALPLTRDGEPEEVGSVVAFLSDKASYVTSALWTVNGGANT